VQKYLEVKHQTLFYATSQCILNAEVDAITAAVGGMTTRGNYIDCVLIVLSDDFGAAKPHTFKSSSFSIPAQCGYCQVREGNPESY
jgi:hypothetical protein